MKDIRRLLGSLEPFLETEVSAGLKWSYEKARTQGKILIPPPPQKTVDGSYSLGNTIWNDKTTWFFGLEEKELPQHIAIFGRTGSGKTNCSFLLLLQLLEKNKPFLIFDWKQSYRKICNKNSITLYTPGYYQAPFSFNPLDLNNIPEHSQEAYLRQLLSVLLNVYFRDLKLLSVEGVEYLLLRGFDYLKREKGNFTFFDLYHWATQYKTISRERDWKASLLNVLYKLTTGPLGDVLNPDQSINLEEIIKGRTIIELQWLGSPKDKSFLIQILLLQLYYHFSQQNPTPNLKFLIVIEEAHNILLKHLEDYETIAEMILRQIREYGVGICLLDQHPSLMSLPALGTYTTICFNLRAREDIQVMETALNLEEDREYISMLRRGQAIVKLQDRYIKPFLVGFGKAACKERTDFTTRNGFPQRFPQIKAISEPDKPSQEKENPKAKFLLDVHSFSLSPITERYKRLGLGSKQGSEIQRQLVQQKQLRPVWINLKKTRIKLFEITEIGKQFLRDRGIDLHFPKRKGSLLHQFWQDRSKKKFEENGYSILEEVKIGEGRAVDLVAYRGNRKIAVEIETGKSDYLGNIRKCQEEKFDKIVVVATSRKVKRKIKEKMEEDEMDMESIVVITGNEMESLVELNHLPYIENH